MSHALSFIYICNGIRNIFDVFGNSFMVNEHLRSGEHKSQRFTQKLSMVIFVVDMKIKSCLASINSMFLQQFVSSMIQNIGF